VFASSGSGYDASVLHADPESALPVLHEILERYADSTEPGEQRIVAAVKSLIAELELELGEAD
jgi:hypothetical protein